tara:strand:+ start:246 stop:479 length:234 start_codon:yes stop_codon:yes gene_type:complete
MDCVVPEKEIVHVPAPALVSFISPAEVIETDQVPPNSASASAASETKIKRGELVDVGVTVTVSDPSVIETAPVKPPT